MFLEFKIIGHRKQRYDTVGDYYKKKNHWRFSISWFPDKRYSIALFLHEVIEFFLCRAAGITVLTIDNFDIIYENTRKSGIAPCGCRHLEEPGNDPHAPYYAQHQVASVCERLIVEGMGIKWDDYERAVETLSGMSSGDAQPSASPRDR